MSDHADEIVEIYRARNLPEAHAIRLLMEREEIVVSIANEILQGIIGETAMGWSTSPRLMVKQQDAERARAILLRHLEHTKHEQRSMSEDVVKCLACGAVMNGDAECAACGWTYGEAEPEAGVVPVRNLEPATAEVPAKATVVDQPLTDREETLPVLSDNPVLPVREVWFEVAAVMCIGFWPHVADAFLMINPNKYPYWEYAIYMTVYALSSSFATLYIIHRSGESWREFGIGWPTFTDGVLGSMLMVVLWYFGAIVYYGVQNSLTPEEGISGLPETPFEFALMPIMIVLAAFSEEVIMRCYLITRWRQLTHRLWLGVPLSAFMFALYHSHQGVPGFAEALFTGMLLGSMFAVYPRIWPLVIGHATFNIALQLYALRQQ